MRKKTLERAMLVALAGSLLQFGGCLQLFGREVVVGAGRTAGTLGVGAALAVGVGALLEDLIGVEGEDE